MAKVTPPDPVGLPEAAPATYERELKSQMLDVIFLQLRTNLEYLGKATDATMADVRKAVADAIQLSTELLDQVAQTAASGHVQRVAKWHRARILATFAASGIDGLYRERGLDLKRLMSEDSVAGALAARIADNVALIKTVPPRLHESLVKRMQGLALDGWRFDPGMLERVLEAEYKSTGWNLRRIVRDQTTKQLGQLTQIRHTQAGFHRYTWVTGGTGDNRRPEHQAQEGEVFRWDEPPPTGHPGHAILCMCQAAAYIEDADIDLAIGEVEAKGGGPPKLGVPPAPRVHDASHLDLPRPGKLNKYAKRTRTELLWMDKEANALAKLEARIKRLEAGTLLPGDHPTSGVWQGVPSAKLAEHLRNNFLKPARKRLDDRMVPARWTEHAAEEAEALLGVAGDLTFDQFQEVLERLNERPIKGAGLTANPTGIHAARGRALFDPAKARLERIADRELFDGTKPYQLQGRKNVRAYYSREATSHRIKFDPQADGVGTMVHEIAHAFEYEHEDLSKASKGFAAWQVRSGQRSALKLEPNAPYVDTVLAYSTKPYPRRSTEVVTVGIEMLTTRTRFRDLIDKDPNLFRFIYSNVLRRGTSRPTMDVERIARDVKAGL